MGTDSQQLDAVVRAPGRGLDSLAFPHPSNRGRVSRYITGQPFVGTRH
jgi:hypothetical protein